MTPESPSRRDWMLSSVGLMALWPEIVAAQDHARHAAAARATEFVYFDRATAAEIEAIAAQIIPTDDTPGAREAGVIYFIDRALTSFFKENQEAYRKGLAEVETKRAAMFPGSSSIASLDAHRQLELVRSIDGTPFFEMVRAHTMFGFFGSPDQGGNRDFVGWKLLGMDPVMSFQPPFGYYDAQARKAGAQ
jgi:gluconate 2-dehydrogenase gamma chain